MTLWPGCMTICGNFTPGQTEVIFFASSTQRKFVANVSGIDCWRIKHQTIIKGKKPWCFTGIETEHGVNSISRSCFAQLNYSNALLNGVPKTFLNKLQNIQTTARLTSTSRYNHITSILKQLHWLPEQYRINPDTHTHTKFCMMNLQHTYIH